MRIPLLIGLMAGLMGAQSAPPRKDIPAIAKTANGAVVSVIMSDKDGRPIAQGSGFFVSKDGRIVTNYHVIQNGSSAAVKLPDGAFFVVDGVLAFDKDRDVAIIKAHGENFRTVTLGNSGRLQVGEEVVAIGNPLSLESTVSSGIVSGIRTVKPEGGKFLQITAPISPGSSGGPLFNMAGEVVGITTLYIKGGENLNFAIPINDVKPMLRSGFPKLINFPDEPKVVGDIKKEKGTEKQYHPKTGREYYQQLYDSGGFAELIAEDKKLSFLRGVLSLSAGHYVCFNDDDNAGEFFVFTASRYDQQYSDAAAALLKIAQQYKDAGLHSGEVMHDPKFVQALRTMKKIQESATYVDFYEKDWAQWSLLYPKMDPRFRLGALIADIYKKGVKEGVAALGWDENSDSWVSYNPDTSGAYVTENWTHRLFIEPSTLRYRKTATLTLTAGKGETKATDSKTFEESGTCEAIVESSTGEPVPPGAVIGSAVPSAPSQPPAKAGRDRTNGANRNGNKHAVTLDFSKLQPIQAPTVAPSATTVPSGVPPGWQKCPRDGGDYYYASACPTTARVIRIERAVITVPGMTVEDYATCIKPFRDLPDDREPKKSMTASCKQMADLGIPPGYYPPRKEPGFMVTFETPTALYVASTQGRCTDVVDGRCRGDWAPDVVVGQTYEFIPPGVGETLITLSDPGTKDNPAPYVRLIGHLESVVERKRTE